MLLLELVGAEAVIVAKRTEKAEIKLVRHRRRIMVDFFLGKKKVEDGSKCTGLQV